MFFQADKFNLDEVRKKIAENRELHAVLSTNAKNETKFHLEVDKEGSPPNTVKAGLHLAKADADREGRVEKAQEILSRIFAESLTPDPFSAQRELGPAVAAELADRTIWALLVSWALMIVYVAIRFSSWRYGVASVIALVHDSIISIGFIALAGTIVPKTWGLSFDMGLTTLAAILTIIGYAINDKIVVFDRIRENLLLMKKASFAEVLNASVNQTMSRTILTGVMVWVASIILYVLTMRTGGGIAEFAFPLMIGILAGTYSTIFVAVPIVFWWYKGKRPEAA
ncbi:MAG TPA: protein translocase subunit SecF [Planctomycetota bacterium]|nr:protein translocase subunit SecF [Planctomycetota bacterium]